MQSLIETHAWELHPGACQHVLAHRINGYALAAAAAVWNDHRRSQAQRCPRTKPFQTDIAVFHAFQVLVKVGDKTPAHSAYPVHAGWGLGFFATGKQQKFGFSFRARSKWCWRVESRCSLLDCLGQVSFDLPQAFWHPRMRSQYFNIN